MKTLLSLVLSGVAIIALSGCGSSGDTSATGDTSEGTTNPTTPDEIKTSIIGTWKTACYQDEPNLYVIDTVIFQSDGTGTYHGDGYDVAGCNQQDWVGEEDVVFDYSIGATVKALDGNDAVELNIDAAVGDDYYTMVRFDAGNLLLADGDENGPNSGLTADKRANDFSDSDPHVKQP